MAPVILRELKASSRQRGTYYMRMLAATLAIITCAWTSIEISASTTTGQQGQILFTALYLLLLGIIGAVVPLMTMDCISRERREGTLGLLFLTNLKARHIVFAKVVAHGLRATTLWLAVMPVIAWPMLLGGVDWRQVVVASIFTLELMVLSLLVGVTISALSRNWVSSVVLACLLVTGSFFILALGNATAIWSSVRQIRAPWDSLQVGHAFMLIGNPEAWNHSLGAGVSQAIKVGFWCGLAVFAIALAIAAWVLFLLIALHVQKSWQEKPKTRAQQQVETALYTPMFALGFFRGWMRRSLERNPIGWLEKRSVTGRIAGWVWLAIMISAASAVVSYGGLVEDLFSLMMWGLLASLAYVSAASFKRERETGALELILVTPLREKTIVWGRLWGVWGIFLPAFILWAAAVIYCFSWTQRWRPTLLVNFSSAFLVLPVIGLYLSLKSRVVLLAWLGTLLITFALPQIIFFGPPLLLRYAALLLEWHVLPPTWQGLSSSLELPLHIMWPVARPAIQLLIAAFLLRRLHLLLAQRTFSFRIA